MAACIRGTMTNRSALSLLLVAASAACAPAGETNPSNPSAVAEDPSVELDVGAPVPVDANVTLSKPKRDVIDDLGKPDVEEPGPVDDGGGVQPGGDDPAVCAVDSDCPALDDPCQVAKCVAGSCAQALVPAGTLLPASKQSHGDCRALACDPYGKVGYASDLTDEDDGNECTVDSCDLEGAHHVPALVGTACSKGACAEDGFCHKPGDVLWKANLPMPASGAVVDCVAVDANDAPVVSGRLLLGAFPYSKAFVAKLKPNGGFGWTRDFGGQVDGVVRAAFGPGGTLVAAWGSGFTSAGGKGVNVLALDANGDPLWERVTDPGLDIGFTGLAVDAGGAIRVGHDFRSGCFDFGGGLVCDDGAASFDVDGGFLAFEAGAALPGCGTTAVTSSGATLVASASGGIVSLEKLTP